MKVRSYSSSILLLLSLTRLQFFWLQNNTYLVKIPTYQKCKNLENDYISKYHSPVGGAEGEPHPNIVINLLNPSCIFI